MGKWVFVVANNNSIRLTEYMQSKLYNLGLDHFINIFNEHLIKHAVFTVREKAFRNFRANWKVSLSRTQSATGKGDNKLRVSSVMNTGLGVDHRAEHWDYISYKSDGYVSEVRVSSTRGNRLLHQPPSGRESVF